MIILKKINLRIKVSPLQPGHHRLPADLRHSTYLTAQLEKWLSVLGDANH